MATINFTQTDTNATIVDGGGCSGGSAAASGLGRVSSDGATAGTGTPAFSLGSSATNSYAVNFQCNVDSGVNWNAGTWTWRLNITTANMNLTLQKVFICRVNSGGTSQAVIGSVTGLALNIGTTGVKSGNITGVSQSPSVGDVVNVVFVFDNAAMSTQSANMTPNQNIDSPFALPGRTPRPTSIGHPFII